MRLGIEIFVHGKPSEGELVTSGKLSEGLDERVYTEFFNSNLKPTVSPCFVYEIRTWKSLSYSTYSLYSNGKDSFGSGNGYCVVTLLVKGYYTEDLAVVNNILKELYSRLIASSVLDDSFNYKVKTIKGHIDLLSLQDLAEKTLESVPFLPIDAQTQFGRPSEKPICLNLEDANYTSVYNYLREQGRVYVSSKFPSIQQLEDERRKRQSAALNERNSSQTTSNARENQTRDFVHSDPESVKEIRNLSQKIDLILKRLPAEKAGNFPEFHTQSGDLPDNSLKTSVKGVSLFNWITVVNCILLLLCLFRCTSGGHSSTESDYNPIEVTDSINESISGKDARISDVAQINEGSSKESDAIISFLKQYTSIKIDVQQINQGKIKKDTSHILSLKSGDQNVITHIGHFETTSGAEITKNETGDYVLRGLEVGEIIISYLIDDKAIIERTISITQ